MPPQVLTVNEDGNAPTTTQNVTQGQGQGSHRLRHIPRAQEDTVLTWQAPPDYEATEDNAVFIAGEPPLPPVPPPSFHSRSRSLLSVNDAVQTTDRNTTRGMGTGTDTGARANTVVDLMSSLSLNSSAGATVDTSSMYRAISTSTPSTGQAPTWSPAGIDPIVWQGLLARAQNNGQSSALLSQPLTWQDLALALPQAPAPAPAPAQTQPPRNSQSLSLSQTLTPQPQSDTTTLQDLLLAHAEFNSTPHTSTSTTPASATGYLPTYVEAQTPRVSLTYTFSPKEDDHTCMILIPPPEAPDSRPAYHIRVTYDLFDPTLWVSTIKRGGRGDGRLVSEFVMRPGCSSLEECMHFKGEETLIFRKLLAGKNDKWYWTLKQGSLMWRWLSGTNTWECQHVTDRERVKLKRYKIIAEFTPSFSARTLHHRSPRSTRPATLKINPKEGYQFFDEIVVSVLIVERRRRHPTR